MTVDELKIVIEAETSQARKQLKDILDAVHELADAAGVDLDGAFSEAEAGIRSSTDSIKNKVKDATKDTEKNLKSMANTANKTSKSVKGGAGAMSQEFGELAKRLSLAHLLVAAIEKTIEWVAKTLKESVETLAKFDSGINKTYGNFKNSYNYMKNSITGAIAPLVSQILPVVIKILNAIGDALNSLSRKIAIITGAKSYITAKKSVDGYTESVKNLKKAFASFDELDTLSSVQDQAGLEDLYETELIDYSNLSESEKSLRRIGEILGFISNAEISPVDTENLNYGQSIGDSIKSAFDDARASIASTWDLLEDTGALEAVAKIVSDLIGAMSKLFGWVSRT